LLCVKDNLKQTDNVNLSILNKNFNNVYGDCAFTTYKINRNFTMNDLKLMIKHINGIETLIIDDFDVFFDAQIYLPNLKNMFVSNCKINKNNLQLYKNNDIVFTNCVIY
jgi:hypothetical protein